MSSAASTTMTESQWETYQISLAIVFAIAFLMLIWTLMKCAHSQHYHVLPWWGHILMFLFVFPISMLTSAAELYQQYYPPSDAHPHRKAEESDSETEEAAPVARAKPSSKRSKRSRRK